MSDGKKTAASKTKSSSLIRNESWKYIQEYINVLVNNDENNNDKRIQVLQLDVANEKVRNLLKLDQPKQILDYYQNTILNLGMIVLRFSIEEKRKKLKDILLCLSYAWDYFYSITLHEIMAIFIPLGTSVFEVRDITLLAFRDLVLLKIGIEQVLENGQIISPHLRQMFLVLAGIHESKPASENYMRLEALVVKVIRPYIGEKGYYPPFEEVTNKNSSTRDSLKKKKERKKQTETPDGSTKVSQLTNESTKVSQLTNESTKVSQLTNESTKVSQLTNEFTLSMTISESTDEMSEYIGERNRRWLCRDEILDLESVK
ncbi:proline-rich protein 5 isoform X1 [Hydra vulgaris]|nr:proline-rich protein 5 isoform X1 [Hydra vulgaris]XP_004208632.1 proline-rich protein 5 isoform X1 [Hydra vulgaris]XP_012558258.1 proline-rich protein 5 isoform X1 [Hydra vulgaris]XP_047134162.1 proline-rich protein 5 isoform X1 [Hydra vulgaris]